MIHIERSMAIYKLSFWLPMPRPFVAKVQVYKYKQLYVEVEI